MSGLHRTPLTTSQKVKCAAKALAGQGVHGTMSALSEEFGISRPTLYEARVAACETLEEHFEKAESAPIGQCVCRSMKRSCAARWWR